MAIPYPAPDTGTSPRIRTTAKYPFAITGIDFFGLFIVKEKGEELKAYIIVFSCAASRGVHFAITRTMEQQNSLIVLITSLHCTQEL